MQHRTGNKTLSNGIKTCNFLCCRHIRLTYSFKCSITIFPRNMTMKCQQKCNPDWLGANWLVGDESKETVWRNISLLHIFLTVHSQLPVGRGPPAANQGNPEIAFFRFKTKKWKIQSSDPRLQDRLKMMGDQQVGINYFIFFFFCFLDPILKHTKSLQHNHKTNNA